MKLLQSVVNKKLNSITGPDLLRYAAQYNITLSPANAEKIANHFRGKKINVFDPNARMTVVKEIAALAGNDTAKQVNDLILQFTK
ncbi:DUF2624 domain-containing protein [Mangrovibacillus cuniculi]|uniref:DUF2624 domain-containing protein n=1 Tax=Mangrovibacillus cuniculi TaxID=2593652 RepID=A0A7S8CBJ3_9BACI|nr:DUF2624 domain-containing protein [Mangrovibacillus cuniculi]QPC46902.1 DUF2624 domain-containing protein [Mangrovibacillus cuniculi]